MEILENILAGHPFWNGLPPHFLPLISRHATLEHFSPQQQIFLTGSDAEHFYLILHGKVALETPFIPGKGIVPIQTLGAGEALGWSWFFSPYQWNFSARAVESTEVIAFDAKALRKTALEHHDFGYELAVRVGSVMLGRLQKTRLQLLDMYDMRC